MDLGPRSLPQDFFKPIHLAGLMAFRSPGSKWHEWLRCVSRVAELSICRLLNKIKTRPDSAPIVFFSVHVHKECHQEARPNHSCLSHCLLIVADLELKTMMVLKIRRQRPTP